MVEERLVAFSLVAAGTGEVEQLEDFLNASVHFGGLLSASAVLNSARPLALHLYTIVAVEAVAAGTLEGER